VATFGLVHGGMHGAWCWEELIPELEARGHSALTVDLPIGDAAAGCREYAQAAARAFEPGPDDLVVVGHSMGGLTIPLIPALRPVSRLVYLCAILPTPGYSFLDYLAVEPEIQLPAAMTERTVGADGLHRRTEEQAIAVFFHDAPHDIARRAVDRLRPQSQTPMTEKTPLRALPDVASTYILGADDRCINAAWVRAHIPSILGVAPLELPGSHSPFLARPAELADLLDSVVR
jgi:pimeloyl-ACP methyl ester carboxylesterase